MTDKRIAVDAKHAQQDIKALVDKDIKEGNITPLTYSAGLAGMLGDIYDYRYNGVAITLRIDGRPNYVPNCLAEIVDAKVNKILNLHATGKGQIDESVEMA